MERTLWNLSDDYGDVWKLCQQPNGSLRLECIDTGFIDHPVMIGGEVAYDFPCQIPLSIKLAVLNSFIAIGA